MSGFRLSDQPIERLEPELKHAGAISTFDGVVRDLNDGLPVEWLEYEAYGALAESEGGRVVEEAMAKFEISDALCVHRTGHLKVGEVAIRVAVSSAHRRAAFEACEYIVEQVKHRVPIWKKEGFVDGSTRWVNYQESRKGDEPELQMPDFLRFDRQMRLPDIGEEGQAKLARARVLVLGAGGLGCPALTYLAAAGVGEITICDDDTVDLSNLPRQTLYTTEDCGEFKAVVAAQRLGASYPGTRFSAVRERATDANLPKLMALHDVVLDCTDGWDTKLAISDACVRDGRPLVTASVYRWSGFLWSRTADRPGGCMRCHMESSSASPSSCETDGVSGPVVGCLGAIQASEAVRLLTGAEPAFAQSMLLLDLAAGSCQTVGRPTDAECPVCGTGRADAPSRSIRLESYRELLDYQVVDMRLSGVPKLECDHVRASEREVGTLAAEAGPPLLLVCERGARSLSAAFRAEGVREAWSLQGGVRSLDALNRTREATK